MDFEKRDSSKLIKNLGFLFSFILFTVVLFFILRLLNKIPENWNYFPVLFIGLGILILGKILEKVLK